MKKGINDVKYIFIKIFVASWQKQQLIRYKGVYKILVF